MKSAKEKILTAYKYATEVEKFMLQETHDILKERLFFSKRYIREVLPLEAKESKFTNKPKTEVEHVTSHSSASSAFEEFR